MPSVEQHYDQVLADVYAWMAGGFDAAIARNAEFFAARKIAPRGCGRAVDLGAGCGFQAIPLATLGFSVVAIDTDRKLLDELREHAGDLDIAIVRDDMVNFDRRSSSPVELIVCMLDTVLHLKSKELVGTLFAKVHAALEPEGRFIVTFRDMSRELTELERFIPVRSDDDTVFTCFLEFEPETVKIHDLLYRRTAGRWTFHKSFYRKLRLSRDWVEQRLRASGFAALDVQVVNDFATVVATKH